MSDSDEPGKTSETEQGYASDNPDKVNEAEDDNDESKKRKIDPTTSKKIVRRPQPKLDAERLRGPKGLHTLEDYFKDFRFRGQGHEKNDLNCLMKRLEHWTHRLFPKYEFTDCLHKLAVLGSKRAIQTQVNKIRLGMVTNDNQIIQDDAELNEDVERVEDSEPLDEFDALIAEEIERHKNMTTPQRPSTCPATPGASQSLSTNSTNATRTVQPELEVTDEIKEKIERNRQLAIQKRLARLEKDEAERKALQEKSEKILLLEQDQENTAAGDENSETARADADVTMPDISNES